MTASGAANPNPIQYAGTQNDGTGLYSMGARYYSPLQSRFISQDPIGFAGGTTDLYAYVEDNPVNSSDPNGLKKSPPCLPPNWSYGGHCHPPTPPGTCLYFPHGKLNKGCPICVPYTPPPNRTWNTGLGIVGMVPFAGTVVSGGQAAYESSQHGSDAEAFAAAEDYNRKQQLWVK